MYFGIFHRVYFFISVRKIISRRVIEVSVNAARPVRKNGISAAIIVQLGVVNVLTSGACDIGKFGGYLG